MSNTTRRDFLATTSLAVAGTILTAPSVRGQSLPTNIGHSPLPANAFLPEPIGASTLRALAASGIEAARAAGASYADIRVAERHWLSLELSLLFPVMPITQM